MFAGFSLRVYGLAWLLPWALASALFAQGAGALEAVRAQLDPLYPALDAFYRDLHGHPELSGQETRTALKLAERLVEAGFTVTTGVGGTGVVGVLRNWQDGQDGQDRQGPTLLLRAELDALPVTEQTGLAYASLNRGAMHACGHDMHLAGLSGAAGVLAQLKDRWRGTLVLVGQPAEETVLGARGMIADGLFTRFPRPDFALAVHDDGSLPAGQVSWVEGFGFANVDSVNITLFGQGGHGARPQATVDPIVLAARTVLALQTIVSREKDPMEPGVVTVGSIHGGSKNNIIPDQVTLQLTVRSYSQAVRKQLLQAITRIAKGEARTAGAPREPAITLGEAQDACWNDPALTRRLAKALGRALGGERVVPGKPEMGGEDFGEFGRAAGIPSVLLRIGAVEPGLFKSAQAAGTVLPSVHSSRFAPDRERTLRTDVEVLALAALELLPRS